MPFALPQDPPWSALAPLTVTGPARRIDGASLEIPTSEGPMLATALPDGLRLQFGRRDQPVYPILAGAPKTRPMEFAATAEAVEVRWDGFRLILSTAPLAFRLERHGRLVQQSANDGHFVRERRLPPFARTGQGWFAALDLTSGEPVYGLGEKFGRLNKRGELARSAVFDALGVNADRAYKNTPFCWSPSGWGVFAHTPADVTHAVGHALWSHRSYALHVAEDALDLFLFAGHDGADLLRAYADLAGYAPAPPEWSLGAILSRAYYRDAAEILAAARDVRAKNLPITTITFDGRAWQDTPTRFHFNFDPARYPDPKPVIAELKAMGFKICVWEYPLVAVNGPLFADMAAKGWLLKNRRSGEAYRYRFDPEPFGQVLTQLPESGLVDFTHPEAYAFWRDAHKPLLELGIDMVKSDFGEQVEDECLAHNGDTGARLRNVYPLLYNACVHEAVRLYCKDGGFLFGRAGWAGSQRYPVQWGGDPQSDWEGLAASIRGGLSWGLSGGPFHAHDVGGFYKDRRDPELYVRWTQAAIFFSHLRFHGIGPREPWTYGAAAEAAARAALALREKLRPYLWAAVREAAATALPVQRAMVLACPDDPASWAFEQQFFCGPDLLVMPCLAPGGEVLGYLPEGDWRRLFGCDEVLKGPFVLRLTLELDEMAVFARAGSGVGGHRG